VADNIARPLKLHCYVLWINKAYSEMMRLAKRSAIIPYIFNLVLMVNVNSDRLVTYWKHWNREVESSTIKKIYKKLRGVSPRVNYTGQATAAGRRS
jgi:hypothetical protein